MLENILTMYVITIPKVPKISINVFFYKKNVSIGEKYDNNFTFLCILVMNNGSQANTRTKIKKENLVPIDQGKH